MQFLRWFDEEMQQMVAEINEALDKRTRGEIERTKVIKEVAV